MSNDYGIDIRGEAGTSGLSSEEKGKTKIVNIVTLEPSTKHEEVDVMPLGKRTNEEREGKKATRPSKKKGKAKEGDDAKVKKKRGPRRKFHVADLPLGVGQLSYNLQEDVSSRKVDITFGQLMEIAPKMKRQWKSLVNPTDK